MNSASLTNRLAATAVAIVLAAAAILALGTASAHAADTPRAATALSTSSKVQTGIPPTAGRSADKPLGRVVKSSKIARRSLAGLTIINYCFKFANGNPYNYETTLQVWVQGAWHNTVSHRAGINGCGTYAGVNGYYFRVQALTRGANYLFRGFTGWRQANGGSFHLGTWFVYGG